MRYRVKVHEKGLIVIPTEVRRRLGIYKGSYLELIVKSDDMRPVVPQEPQGGLRSRRRKGAGIRLIETSRREEVDEGVRS